MNQMRNLLTMAITLGLSLFLLNSCGVSGKTTANKPGDQQKIYAQNTKTLADLLITKPGIQIKGGVPTLRGGPPLYVVDGAPKGRDYFDVSGSLNVNEIASVEVLTDPVKTMRYGTETQYGVILIKTKTP